MKHKIYKSVNYLIIEIDDSRQLAPLADYIDAATERVRVIEIRYHRATNNGVIVADYNDDVTTEQVAELIEAYEQRTAQNHAAGEGAATAQTAV